MSHPDGLDSVDHDDSGSRVKVGPLLEHVIIVTGNEGIVAGNEVRNAGMAGTNGVHKHRRSRRPNRTSIIIDDSAEAS